MDAAAGERLDVRNNGTMRGGCLPYAHRTASKKRSARSTWEAPVENGTTPYATAVPVLSGSSASSSSSSVEQHRPRRATNSRVVSQPRVFPDVPEVQRLDLLQLFSEPNLRRSNACLNFHHFGRVIPTVTVYSCLLEFRSP